jgi:protoporphyrinogen oxidase
MRQVIVIGGGLVGLSAACELQHLNVPYTLIEVKNRLGGSLQTVRREEFVIDAGPLAFTGDRSFLDDLGLHDATFTLERHWAFKNGAQSLVDALAKPLNGTIMRRMAASSVGLLEDRFAVCLENGLLLDARALILAVPARYASHMIYSLKPELALGLERYHYDTMIRLSLGYPHAAMTAPPRLPPDVAFAFCHWTDHPCRVPPEHVLIQLGVRLDPARATPAALVEKLLPELGWPLPLVSHVHFWAEADPLTCYDSDHGAKMAALRALLPCGMALVGSDYGTSPFDLGSRVAEGRRAARDIATWLGRE